MSMDEYTSNCGSEVSGMNILSFEKPDKVYHGTRCPTEIIEERGLVYDKEFLLEKTKEFCRELDVNFDVWRNSPKPFPSGKSVVDRMLGISRSGRCQIFVTCRFEHAASYATRNPEILWDVIRSIMHFKHPRKRSDQWYKEIEHIVKVLLESIGSPKVVVIDAKHPDIDAIARTNQTLKHGYVPINAILEVVER